MEGTLTLRQSTVGKKALMAVSGVILLGFVIAHLLGNLQLYAGPEKINHYAASLRHLGPFLWIARLALLGAVLVHMAAAFQLWSLSKAARPVPYKMHTYSASSYASRTMRWGGVILLLFIVYHLAHLTFGKTFGLYEFDPHNVYNNVVYGFQVWWISAIYIIGNIALGMHLYHGAWSFLQTLGANHPKYNRYRNLAAHGLALTIVLGNISFPMMVMAGVVQPTDQEFFFPELAGH